ncbi:hypothetical protein TNIN_263641 [Trichonephila inaurata madagascariensis]|uniref:Uncharacterized protein n=1 Tax=Trichonephila inaurata madagascariensis TaxID=2747483 RepID=A0A8X6XYM9_9ARAC|nr:hypothetical protein TNIN_263641 [Trichonephila inaurata madagascariensis]
MLCKTINNLPLVFCRSTLAKNRREKKHTQREKPSRSMTTFYQVLTGPLEIREFLSSELILSPNSAEDLLPVSTQMPFNMRSTHSATTGVVTADTFLTFIHARRRANAQAPYFTHLRKSKVT